VLELDSLLERAARLVQESFGYHHVGLFTVDRERDELVMKTRAGDFAPLYPPDHRLKLGQGVVGWAGRRGETLLANDVDAEPCYVNLYPDLVPTRSELSVPIRVGEEIVGVLDVQSPQLNAFDQSDVMVVETLADQIAVAIENARLHEAVRRELTERARAEERLRQRNRELELLNRAGQAFLSTLDLDHVLATVLEEVRQLLNVTACSAWVVDLVTEELVCRQVTNPQSEIVRGWRLPPGQGLVGWATQHGESLNVSDVRADERHFKGVDQKTGLPLRSILTVPLRIKEDVIGVLQAVDTEVGRFNSTDLMLVESLASTAAGAIESARLYEALRASQEYARNIIDSSLDMIVAVDMDRRIVEFNTAAQGALGYRPGEVVGERIDILYADQQQAITVHETTIEKGRCVREVSSRRKNGQVFPSFLSSSVLCDTQGELVGVMGVSRDITERVRAEEALRRRNRELALLNEANQALSASLDQDQVLATFLDEVCRLLGVAAISAWLVDPGTDELVCRQATGPRSEIVHDWRLAPGEGIAGRVAANGESLFVPDTRADPRHFKGVDKQTGLEIRSILSVPLRVKQEVIGALQIVDGTANRFRPTDLVLLESLAATAAIAIEHARLYEQARQDAEARARLLREVNHRVKNNLSAIIGILYAERQYVEIKGQASYQSVMQDLANRVRGLATVHSLLSTSEWAPLRLSDLAAQISRSSLQVLPPGKHISIDVPLSPVRVTPDQAHYLALVINELATNTVKHAAQERDTAQISVHIALDDDVVLLEFRDDGPGYPEDVLRLERHSVGFDLIRSIVRDGLRGELVLRNDHGAVTLIRFKAQTEADEI
jgi:PAS domain S-box-containing protein